MTTEQTDTWTDRQSDPYVPLCFSGDTKRDKTNKQMDSNKTTQILDTFGIPTGPEADKLYKYEIQSFGNINMKYKDLVI